MPALVSPDERFHRSFCEAITEEPHQAFLAPFGDEELSDPQSFAGYVAMLLADVHPGSPRPPGFVPATCLWWVDGDTFLGRVSIRHRLTEGLRTLGGHIGYWVRPSARGHGHGAAQFRAALPVAAGLGIDPALLTCDADNGASRRIIESAGGILENQLGAKLRYWVPTAARHCPNA